MNSVGILSYLVNLNEKEDIVTSLRKEKLPLIIWGAGQVALEIIRYLESEGITIADIYVDDNYYMNNIFLEKHTIISKTQLLRKYKRVNVIVGHSNYKMIKEIKSEIWINKLFYFACSAYGEFEKASLDVIKTNIKQYEMVLDMLEDEESRIAYITFFKTKISGNADYILDIVRNETSYFHNDLYDISEHEVYLDVGASVGGNIKQFLKECNCKYDYIYAVEPDRISREQLLEYVESIKLDKIDIASKGAWNREGEMSFLSDKESSCVVEDNSLYGEKIFVTRLDDIFDYSHKISLLEIQYKDGALEAIQGAEKILKEHRPKIAVMVGCGMENIYKLPILIKNINPDYKLYLRYNRGFISTLTLYGLI